MSKNSYNGMGVIHVLVTTSGCVESCKDAVNKCIQFLNLPKTVVLADFARSGELRIVGGSACVTHVLVTGGKGGWKRSGMEAVCDYLEKCDYIVQASHSPHSFVPQNLFHKDVDKT